MSEKRKNWGFTKKRPSRLLPPTREFQTFVRPDDREVLGYVFASYGRMPSGEFMQVVAAVVYGYVEDCAELNSWDLKRTIREAAIQVFRLDEEARSLRPMSREEIEAELAKTGNELSPEGFWMSVTV